MIEKLKKLPVEEQIKRLTNLDSLREILLNVNSEQIDEYFDYLSSIDGLNGLEKYEKDINLAIDNVIKKAINDSAFFRHLVLDLNFFVYLASYISEISDEFITGIITSTNSSEYCSEISDFIGVLLPDQLEKHIDEIKKFINDNDVSSFHSRFTKNIDILYYFLDKYPERISYLDDETLKNVSREKIKECIKKGDCIIYDFTTSIIRCDPEYIRLYLEKSEVGHLSGRGEIIDNVDSQYWDYELYLLALEKGYHYSYKSPDIIIDNPEYLKATIEYGAISKFDLNKLPQDKFTPEIFKLAIEKGYFIDEQTPKYVFENYEYLKNFSVENFRKYIKMIPKEQIKNEVIDLYLKSIYDRSFYDIENSYYINEQPLKLLSDDIEKNADLAIMLMNYGYFKYVLDNFDDNVLENNKVKIYLKRIFPNIFDSLNKTKDLVYKLEFCYDAEKIFNDNPLSLPFVRYVASFDNIEIDVEKLKNDMELLKEFIKVSTGRENYYNLKNLTDNVVDDEICRYMFDGNCHIDRYRVFECISNSSKLVKSAIIYGYKLNYNSVLDEKIIDMIRNDDEIIKTIFERSDFSELVFLTGQEINFDKFMSENQRQCIKIYYLLPSFLANEYSYIVNSKFKNVDNEGLSLSEIFNSHHFNLVYRLGNFNFNVLKNDLTDSQVQCISIFGKLTGNIKNDFTQYISSRFSDIDKNGILLSSLYSSKMFDLVLNLLLFDYQIIKTDLSKKQLQVLKMYSSISSFKLRNKFESYVIEHSELNIGQISDVAGIFDKISKSNSLEIKKLEGEIVDALLQLDDPIGKFNQIEDIFLKNNLPTVGKVYKVFEIMHPDFNGFNFSNDKVSPDLKSKSNNGREIIVFADLIKSFMGSNNRSMINYLNSLELGNKLFIEVSESRLSYEQLSNEQIEVLQEFVSHLNTLYNNTKKGKNGDNKELTGNIIDDIRFLKTLFSMDGKLEYDLPDRIIKMYCHFAGIDTLEQAKQYIKRKVQEADSRGRMYAESVFTLEEGDFVKGIGGIEYLGNILQNGSNSKEYLGSSSGSDATPLDTDLCIVLENGTINQCIYNTVTDRYGPIYFVLKNRDNRFTITRRSPKEKIQSIDTKLDLTKLEAFYTGVIGNGEHYGIRTGFASSEIDYIVVNSYDDRIGLEIAMNGFYIPVVDRQGKLVFSTDEYDKLRSKMNGLSYYGMGEFILDSSISSMTSELEGIVKGISDNRNETHKKAYLIDSCIRLGLGNMGLSLTHKIDLLPNSAVLFNTGSTGRYTNLPGDGDFDLMMQVDNVIYDNPSKMNELRNNIIIALGGNPSDVLVVGNDIREFKTIVTDSDGKEYPVEIDITFTHKTDKTEYASDVCVSDRLNNISSDEDCNLVKANVILAKKLLKELGAYKPSRKDKTQGGMGGIGVENWILQNGGTLYSAAKSFLECADKCSSFDEFVSKYKLYNFGINHMADKRGFYPHDNYIENMNGTGYEKMKQGLKKYIELCEKGISNPCEETINQISNSYYLIGVIDKFKYEDSSEIKNDTQQILSASVDSSIEIQDVNLGQTGYMYQYSDGDKTYLVKTGVNKHDMKVRPARVCVQECASVLQGIISPSTCVPVKVYGKGSVKVSVQEKIDGAHNITTEEIIKNHTRELLGEYVCDYLLGNFDSDAQNFIVDKEGVLRGIDKEQSYKYLLEEGNASLSLDFSYNPSGSRLNIYSQFLSYLEQNGLSEENLSYLNSIVAKIQKISDEEYINMFKSYAYAYDAGRSGEILSKILQRKKYFEANIQNFIQQLIFNYDCKTSSK